MKAIEKLGSGISSRKTNPGNGGNPKASFMEESLPPLLFDMVIMLLNYIQLVIHLQKMINQLFTWMILRYLSKRKKNCGP